MTTQTLSTALMGVALILTLFSEKLFNNMKKSENNLHYNHISRCFVKAALSYFKNTGICLSCILFFVKCTLIK